MPFQCFAARTTWSSDCCSSLQVFLHKVLLNARVFAFSFKSHLSQEFSGMTSLIWTSAVNPYLATMFQNMNFSSLTLHNAACYPHRDPEIDFLF
jgi:hypothetical protein